MDTSLKVPFALDGLGIPVDPALAVRGESYRCPGCLGLVIFRSGTRVRPHFAHRADDNCSQESILHKTAKARIAWAVREWRAGRHDAPIVRHPCSNTRCEGHFDLPMPASLDDAREEVRCGDFVLDVALLGAGEVRAAVEVVFTHWSDKRKVEECPVPFIEVHAGEVIGDPWVWRRVGGSAPRRTAPCRKCVDAKALRDRLVAEAQAAQRADAEKAWELAALAGWTNLRSLKRHYRAQTHHCYKCRKRTPVLTWEGRFNGRRAVAPPFPRPPNITREQVNRLGWTRWEWVDQCVHCNRSQHPYYVWEAPEHGDADPGVWQQSREEAANDEPP